MTAPGQRAGGRWIATGVLGGVLLVGAGLLLWWSARAATGSFALHAQVPAAVDQLLWADSLGGAAAGVRRIAGQLRGAEGIADAAAMLAGLSGLESPQLREVGLRPDAGVAVYRYDGAFWGVTQVSGRRGAEHILGVLERRGHVVEPIAPLDPGAAWWRISARGKPGDVRIHARLRGDLFLLRWRLSAQADDPAQALQRWQEAPRMTAEALGGRPGQLHGNFTLDRALGLQQAARRAMGSATLLFGRLVDRFERAQLDLSLDGPQPTVALALKTAPAGAKDVADYHQGFLAEKEGLLQLGDLLPDEVALLARGRVNPALLDMVPRIVRDRLIPASLLGQVHPALAGLDVRSALIEQLDGQLAAGLLGVDDQAPPDPRSWPVRGLRKTVGGFVALSLKTDRAARDLLERAETLLKEGGAAPQRVVLGAFSGFSVDVEPAPWGLLRRDRALVWISGKGELARFERTAKGVFPSLGKAADSPLERDVLAGRGHWVGAMATTGRVVRSLRRRGVPDHFVSMVASVAALSATLALEPDGALLTLQLRPKAPPKEATP